MSRRLITVVVVAVGLLAACTPEEAVRVAERVAAIDTGTSEAVETPVVTGGELVNVDTSVCGFFYAEAINHGSEPVAFERWVDVYAAPDVIVSPGERGYITHAFPGGSGPHTVQVQWPGGFYSTIIETTC